MALTKYTRIISPVVPSKLSNEIRNSAISFALDHIDTEEDQCDIWFKSALTSEDEDILDVVINDHDGIPLPSGVISVKLQPSESDSTHLLIRGAHAFEADLDGDTESVYVFSEDAELQGVSADVQDHNFGDSLSFKLQAPTGQPAPNDWITVATYADHAYVPHKGRMDITSEGSSTVSVGLRVLVTYYSTATVGFKPKILMNYREWVED